MTDPNPEDTVRATHTPGKSVRGPHYPILLCGDQAEFEREHANTPPKERPDWPLPSFDAQDWAEAFCKIATAHGYKNEAGEPLDEGWMISWFANALMRGFDEHAGRAAALASEER